LARLLGGGAGCGDTVGAGVTGDGDADDGIAASGDAGGGDAGGGDAGGGDAGWGGEATGACEAVEVTVELMTMPAQAGLEIMSSSAGCV
jgi:hypothetical protein